MKYLYIITIFLFTTITVSAQIAQGKEYEHTVTFDSNTFADEDIKNVVSEFREHVFEQMNQKFDFKTRFDESGVMYFETAYPVSENVVDSFFKAKKKTYLSYTAKIEAPTVYAFSTTN